MKHKLFIGVMCALLLGACSSLSHKKDEEALQSVHRVAVVAFSVLEPVSREIGLNLNSGKVQGKAGGSMIAATDAHVEQMFADLVTSFGSQTGWIVMPAKSMIANAGYQTAFDRTMKGLQNKMPPGAGQRQFLVRDLMDYDSPRILGTSGRDELIEALGVDAIVVARVDVSLEGTTVMGVGSRHPRANLSFSVYKKNSEAPIWFEGQLKGTEEESVGKTGFIDESLLGQLAAKSVRAAYAQIGSTTNNKVE